MNHLRPGNRMQPTRTLLARADEVIEWSGGITAYALTATIGD
ncbi:MAG: hypothetical protein WKH97_20175 [Casimicrobiaceae bacterium]